MTRYFLDTEFTEHKLYKTQMTIDLISIGIIAEDGRQLYLQSSEFSPQIVSDWVKDNVLPHLTLCPHAKYYSEHTVFGDHIAHFEIGQCTFVSDLGIIEPHADCCWRTKEQIKNEIVAFMDIEKYGEPEIWTYYGAYDHVVFCQLFGTMMDLPKDFPMHTMDIKQWCKMLGNPELPEQGKGEHNALEDARWNKVAWEFLRDFEEDNEKFQYTQEQIDHLQHKWDRLVAMNSGVAPGVITTVEAKQQLKKLGLLK